MIGEVIFLRDQPFAAACAGRSAIERDLPARPASGGNLRRKMSSAGEDE